MNYILRVTIKYGSSDITSVTTWSFTDYDVAIKRTIEELERLNRQMMATELTEVTGYTIELKEWISGNKYKKVAVIKYDLAL